jgi:hypothetical protein
LLIYSLGTTLIIATATPLTLLPLLTACGPPMSVPTGDIIKIAIEAALQVCACAERERERERERAAV